MLEKFNRLTSEILIQVIFAVKNLQFSQNTPAKFKSKYSISLDFLKLLTIKPHLLSYKNHPSNIKKINTNDLQLEQKFSQNTPAKFDIKFLL